MRGPLVLSALLALVGVSATGGAPVPDQQPAGSLAAAAVLKGPPLAAPALVVDDVPPKRYPPPKPVIVDNSLRVGSRGPEVMALEQRLESLGYLVGKVDGHFDAATSHGVMAFQKVEGLGRNGKGDQATLQRLQTARTPSPAYAGPAYHFEIDIPRQVVLIVKDFKVWRIVHTSTGNNKMFTSQGWSRRAVTPNGTFKIGRKIGTWRISPLGKLYKPSYFNGGIAFHGAPSVPGFAASHGCARIPMPFADWFYDQARIGSVVYVYGGPNGSNPQPWIEDKPATSSSPEQPAQEPSPTPEPSPEPATPTVGG